MPEQPETQNQTLLRPGDSPAFTHYNEQGKASILVVCDHASNAVPSVLNNLGLSHQELGRHIGWDIGSADVGRLVADRLDAPAILSGFSRLVVDPNRALDDPSAFPTESESTLIPGNIKLGAMDRELRADTLYRPYHNAISTRLNQFLEHQIFPALISIHSFTPVFHGESRPWHIGILWDKDQRISKPLLDQLNLKPDICVGDNQPYSGRHPHDFTIDHHAETLGIPHIGIEIRQDLIEDPHGVHHWGSLLGDALAKVLEDSHIFTRFS